MTKQGRRRFTLEYKEQAVAWLSAPGATHASVSVELGVTATQLKTWRLELEAAGSALAIERQRAEAAELGRLRQDNKRLREEVEVLRKGRRISKRTVAKLMKQKGLRPPRGKRRVPITTDSRHAHAVAPNLLDRNFEIALPDTVWLADIS